MTTECHSLNVGLHIDTEEGLAYGMFTMAPTADDDYNDYIIRMSLPDLRQVLVAIMMAGSQLEQIEKELDGLIGEQRQRAALDISQRYSAGMN